MKFLTEILIMILIIIGINSDAQNRICGFDFMLNNQLNNDPSLKQILKETNLILSQNTDTVDRVAPRSELVIKIIVHVVWKETRHNISDEQILGQIEILNRDFNRQNDDLKLLPQTFKSLLPQSGIRFCLAAEDPSGISESGIIRVKTAIEAIGAKENLFFSSMGGSDARNPESYLNIWVADTGEHISGFGTYPNQTPPEMSGVVIHPDSFGKNNLNPQSKGRVIVHEVGHYLGLNHIWGENQSCDSDDGIDDTPLQESAYEGCPIHPVYSCGNMDLFMNFMDYTNEECMVMFTEGQMNRMLTTIEFFRPGLFDSGDFCLESGNVELKNFNIYPNPTNAEVAIDFENFEKKTSKVGKFQIYDVLGKLVFEQNKILSDNMKIDLRGVIPGIYWIRIDGFTEKLILK